MNLTQVKCLLVFCPFAVIGFGPISITCLIGFYIVAMRPLWFLNLVIDLYDKPTPARAGLPGEASRHSASARLKCFLCLLVLFILDIAPIPVASMLAFVIILARPMGFFRIVTTMYGGN